MDDPRTRQSIDDLAEHYLTGVSAPKPTPSIAPSANDPITGPAPIRLSPKPAVMQSVTQNAAALNAMANHTHPNPQRPTPQAIRTGGSNGNGTSGDGHPILRLADADTDQPGPGEHLGTQTAQTQTPARAPGRACAASQAVVMGNLPGLSGPWLTQYAQSLAQRQGPVAIVHLDDDMIDLELVEPRLETDAPPNTMRVPATNDDGLVGLLDALVRSPESPVRTVLIRLSADAEAMSASRLAALDRWTVLCGADDAAVVACYSMLKRLVEHDPRNAGKHVGLMVMGSDESAAQRAVEKVAATAASFLSTPVQQVGQLRQMQPVTVRQMGSFPDPVALWPQLVAWLETLEDPAAAPPTQVTTTDSPARPNPMEPVINQPLTIPPPRRHAAPATHDAAPHAPRQPEPVSAPRTAQAITPGAPAQAIGSAPAEDLFALLAQGPAAIPGGVALDARPPAAPAIQLVVDEYGTLHLLMHHSQADDPRRAVPEMLDARRWVAEHRDLLALTQRDRAFADPAASPPVLHLFTDRAEQATALVARLGDSFRLHLLQKVTLGRETGWFCTPLN